MSPKLLGRITGQAMARVGETVPLSSQTNRADLINSVEVEVAAAAQVSTEAGVKLPLRFGLP